MLFGKCDIDFSDTDLNTDGMQRILIVDTECGVDPCRTASVYQYRTNP